MFKEFHNRLGENGVSLTVLSLLKPHPELDGSESASGDLRTVSQQLLDAAGDDELVDMYSVYPSAGGSLEFLALELVPLRQAIEQLRRNANENASTELRVINPEDEIDDGPGAVNQAMTRLREALHQLFNRAGEHGQQLTVLSLLSEPAADATKT
jgi:hypothetical protein